MFTIISCVQNTVNHDRHLQCAETIQFSPSCCVQNTDNSHCHVNVCAEHRQFCHVVCAEHKINKPQTILTVMLCVRTQTILIVMLCVQIADNCHCHAVCAEHKQNTDKSHRHVVCEEHRQFPPSCCVCRTQTILTVMLCAEHRQTEHRQFSPSSCVQNTKRTQTILTVIL